MSTAVAVRIPAGAVALDGDLAVPPDAAGVVLFAHGSGSSRQSPRNRYVADALHDAQLATLLLDLLTPEEEAVDERTAQLRFDIPLLAERLVRAADWLADRPETRRLPLGCFGASTGAAAALILAAERPDAVGADEKKLEIVARATHLFPEPGALEQVAELAGKWFVAHLAGT